MPRYLHPVEDPRSVDLKGAPASLKAIFVALVDGLDRAAALARHRLLYRPDNSKSNRYFWIYPAGNTTPGAHFLTVNVAPAQYARDAVTVHLKCFSRRSRNQGSELVSDALLDQLQVIRNTAPFLKLQSLDQLKAALPDLVDHMQRVLREVDAGWSIPRMGYSNIEFGLYSFLKRHDSPSWEYPCTPEFLGRRHLDMGVSAERIGLEVHGDYWHRDPKRQTDDRTKKDDVLARGWRLIWVWENALKAPGGFERVRTALAKVRGGERFLEIGEQRLGA